MTYFLRSHKAFRCSALTLFSPLKLHSSVESATHRISSCMPCLPAWERSRVNTHFLPDLQLQLGLTLRPYQPIGPLFFRFGFLLLPPPCACPRPLPSAPPRSLSLPFLVSVVLEALRLSALFCLKLSVRIQTVPCSQTKPVLKQTS